jgi:uncharacterized protein YcbX
MMGEELNSSAVTERGLFGDRAYAVADSSDARIASAKNPKKWPNLFDFRAVLDGDGASRGNVPPVRITLPDGTVIRSDQPDLDRILSRVLGRQVTLQSALSDRRAATAEEYWPDIEGLEHRNTVTDFGLPERTFFDAAFMHLLTTATLDRLRMLYPEGHFEARRFRPNVVVRTDTGDKEFVENAWIGRTVALGDQVRLKITDRCPRCVMTTLPQGDLPADTGILRTAARYNQASVGVYASVIQGGTIRRGDRVTLE